jgi:hypothetical protein
VSNDELLSVRPDHWSTYEQSVAPSVKQLSVERVYIYIELLSVRPDRWSTYEQSVAPSVKQLSVERVYIYMDWVGVGFFKITPRRYLLC